MKARIIQPDESRCPILVTPRRQNGIALTAGHVNLFLNRDELDALIDILDEEGWFDE